MSSYSFIGRMRKRIAAAAIVAVALIVPVAATADTTVKMSGDTMVANATKSGSWGKTAAASYNEVVAVQVVYNNEEDPSSNKDAKNVRVKINIPKTAGKAQSITTKVSADNGNTVNGSGTINLDRADAYLEYIPGTATWKHANTANGPLTVTQKVSDDVVLAANGINLGDEHPCQAGSIVVQARVMVPGLTVDKTVRAAGSTTWATKITAKNGDTIQYQIAYKNTGNTDQLDVEFRDQLPKGVTYVPNSTKLKNAHYPNGTTITSNSLTTNGVLLGSYAPGATAYVMFDAKIDTSALACGDTTLRNTAFVQPKDMNYYYNTADVVVSKVCDNATYACTAFDVTAEANRTAKAKDYKYSATNGATFKNVVLDWGDASTPLTTDMTNIIGKTHQYAKDGTYVITATSHFMVNGKEVTAGGCTKTVTFTSNPTTPSTPASLTKTGPSEVIGLFAGAVVAGFVASRLFLSRRQTR